MYPLVFFLKNKVWMQTGIIFCIKEAPFPGSEPRGPELQPFRPFP